MDPHRVTRALLSFVALAALSVGSFAEPIAADAVKTDPNGAVILPANNQVAQGSGDLFVFTSFKDNPSPDPKLYVCTSRDGVNFYAINGGSPVYSDPHSNSVRDAAPFYDPATKIFYVAYTENNGADNYFSIISSTDLLHWTAVYNVPTGSNGVATTWNPLWFTDNDGSVHIIVSLGATNALSPYYLKLYEMHPTTPGVYTAWSAPAAIGMPSRTWTDGSSTVHTSANDGYNEGYVWRSPEDSLYHMLAVDFSQNGKQVHFTSSTLTGTYTQSNVIGLDGNEGAFVMRLSATRWRLWISNQYGLTGISGTYGYGYADLTSSYTLTTGNFQKVNCPLNQDNGKMIKVPGTALGGAYMTTDPVVGSMRQQNADNVAITGGTMHGVAISDYANLLALSPDVAANISFQSNNNAYFSHGGKVGNGYQSAYGFWRNRNGVAAGTSWQLDFNPLPPSDGSGIAGFFEGKFLYYPASFNGQIGLYSANASGADIVITQGFPSITASGSVTYADGDVITDAAGASAKAYVSGGGSTSSATVTLRWINGTKWFTTGSALSKNGSSLGATVSSPGSDLASGAGRYYIYVGYDTGGSPGLTWWNGMGSTDYPTFRIQY